jgi:hypothetical protein
MDGEVPVSGEEARDAQGDSAAPVEHAPGRMELAAVLAAELRDQPVGVWQRRSRGAAAYVTYLEDEPELVESVAELWEVARSGPSPQGVSAQPGVDGVVVVVHRPVFSFVARSGGPALVMSDRIRGVLRVDRDPSWQVELSALVSELAAVAQGLPPFDESTVPPPPPMPWHRDP